VNTCNMNIRRKRKREVEKLTKKGVEKVKKEKWRRKENRGIKVGQEKSGKSKRKK
jgi:hypothetical protein